MMLRYFPPCRMSGRESDREDHPSNPESDAEMEDRESSEDSTATSSDSDPGQGPLDEASSTPAERSSTEFSYSASPAPASTSSGVVSGHESAQSKVSLLLDHHLCILHRRSSPTYFIPALSLFSNSSPITSRFRLRLSLSSLSTRITSLRSSRRTMVRISTLTCPVSVHPLQRVRLLRSSSYFSSIISWYFRFAAREHFLLVDF